MAKTGFFVGNKKRGGHELERHEYLSNSSKWGRRRGIHLNTFSCIKTTYMQNTLL